MLDPSTGPLDDLGRAETARSALRCAGRVVGLLAGHRLHRRTNRVGARVVLDDGREFTIFRETSREPDPQGGAEAVTLEVRFHLRFVPAGSRVRRWLFERESILNTLLFAGFDGYLVKLWMVDPATADYAGLYRWAGGESAERYATYITRVLAPLSTRGSLGYRVLSPESFDRAIRAPV